MTIITRTAKHCILAIYPFGKKDTVSVEWQESVLALIKTFKIEGICQTYRGAVIAVAPRNPITVL